MGLKALALIASVPLVLAGCGKSLSLERYSPELPLVVGVDGFLSGDLARTVDEVSEETGVPGVIVPVGFWESNMSYIREAEEQGREIHLVGYSSGADQGLRTLKQCEKEGIDVDTVFWIAPTGVQDWLSEVPEVVHRIHLLFPEKRHLIMGWADGDVERAREYVEGYEGRINYVIDEVPGNHMNVARADEFKEMIVDSVRRYVLAGKN